ncbi:Ca2+-dependent phosphoinositide-specific phospholipase C [Sphingobacterium sp. LRF_L2]|uniref:Ca2+-dependent phosphoinositide-specific phospholipase C n=1 Tax=Sphingobacterium sp. LRF_L2 TaxID=3369421 RepID=UPI003F612C79
MKKSTDELRYSDISFKASHNSYERNESIEDQLKFDPSNPYQGGCLGLEFDIVRDSKEYSGNDIPADYFTVQHDTGVRHGKHLDVWLGYVRVWHLNNQGHLPILVQIEPKSGGGYHDFHKHLDDYIAKYFLGDGLDRSNIFIPNDFFKTDDLPTGPYPVPADSSLCAKVVADGWPTLDELKDKFIFVLSGGNGWKTEYANQPGLLTSLICFSDQGIADDEEPQVPEKGNFVFFNCNVRSKNADKFTKFIPKFTDKNLLTRAYEVNGEDLWASTLKAQFSLLATNKIKNNKWAYVSNDGAPYKEKREAQDEFYGPLKNMANGEYRNDHATKMVSKFDAASCLFFFKQEDLGGVYSIKNTKNNKYFTDHITSMGSKVVNNDQKWRLNSVGENLFTIQNLTNAEYMTKKASQLSKNCGTDEIYEIVKRDKDGKVI